MSSAKFIRRKNAGTSCGRGRLPIHGDMDLKRCSTVPDSGYAQRSSACLLSLPNEILCNIVELIAGSATRLHSGPRRPRCSSNLLRFRLVCKHFSDIGRDILLRSMKQPESDSTITLPHAWNPEDMQRRLSGKTGIDELAAATDCVRLLLAPEAPYACSGRNCEKPREWLGVSRDQADLLELLHYSHHQKALVEALSSLPLISRLEIEQLHILDRRVYRCTGCLMEAFRDMRHNTDLMISIMLPLLANLRIRHMWIVADASFLDSMTCDEIRRTLALTPLAQNLTSLNITLGHNGLDPVPAHPHGCDLVTPDKRFNYVEVRKAQAKRWRALLAALPNLEQLTLQCALHGDKLDTHDCVMVDSGMLLSMVEFVGPRIKRLILKDVHFWEGNLMLIMTALRETLQDIVLVDCAIWSKQDLLDLRYHFGSGMTGTVRFCDNLEKFCF